MNVYVRELSAHLAKRGHRVDVFTRGIKNEETIASGANLITLPAGQLEKIEKNQMLTFIPEFAEDIKAYAEKDQVEYDVIHANYWMSGLAGIQLKASWMVPMV